MKVPKWGVKTPPEGGKGLFHITFFRSAAPAECELKMKEGVTLAHKGMEALVGQTAAARGGWREWPVQVGWEGGCFDIRCH